MAEKLKKLWDQYADLLPYAFFGALTTLVNYGVYLPLYNLCGLPGSLSNVIAWAVSVIFAFLTNKPFVFKSHDWSAKVVWPELGKFVGCRASSGVLETGAVFVCVDLLQLDGNMVKLVASVAVVFINYFGSKWLVFKKNED